MRLASTQLRTAFRSWDIHPIRILFAVSVRSNVSIVRKDSITEESDEHYLFLIWQVHGLHHICVGNGGYKVRPGGDFPFARGPAPASAGVFYGFGILDVSPRGYSWQSICGRNGSTSQRASAVHSRRRYVPEKMKTEILAPN